jgi:hexosaminidase
MSPPSPSKSRHGASGNVKAWSPGERIKMAIGMILLIQSLGFFYVGTASNPMFSDSSAEARTNSMDFDEEEVEDATGRVVTSTSKDAFEDHYMHGLAARGVEAASLLTDDELVAAAEEAANMQQRYNAAQQDASSHSEHVRGDGQASCRKHFTKTCSWLPGSKCEDCVWTHNAWFKAEDGCPGRSEVASWCPENKMVEVAPHTFVKRARNYADDNGGGQAMVRDLEQQMMAAVEEDVNTEIEAHSKGQLKGRRRPCEATLKGCLRIPKGQEDVKRQAVNHALVVKTMNSQNVVAELAVRQKSSKTSVQEHKPHDHSSGHSLAQLMIPKPKMLLENLGSTFKLSRHTEVIYAVSASHGQHTEGLNRLARQIAGAHDSKFVSTDPSSVTKCENCVTIRIFPEGKREQCAAMGVQGYSLDIAKGGIVVEACNTHGLFYGLQTLLFHFIRGSPKNVKGVATILSAVKVVDSPRFTWRGFLLDTARHFYTKTRIKALLDVLALYKINRFHWHITDNEAWRLEIKAYPHLTGAGEFYTQADVGEILAYAKHRFIDIVPEIDMPGHCKAALNAYPELLNCRNQQHHTKDVLCLGGNPAILTFAETVLTEVAQLFPFPVIHVGGDETDYKQLTGCKECMETLKNDETAGQLHVNFMNHILAHLKTIDRKGVVWDEFVDHIEDRSLGGHLMAQMWRQQATADVAVIGGNLDVLVSPKDYSYLDYKSSDITFGRMWDWEPAPTWLQPTTIDRILGGEACIWSEKIEGTTLDEWVWPRMLPLAERLWSPRAAHTDTEYQDFLFRVQGQYTLVDLLGKHSNPGMEITDAVKAFGTAAQRPVALKSPGAKVWSTLMTFGGNYPELAFDASPTTFFWTQASPMQGDHLTVELAEPMTLSGVKITAGNANGADKPGDSAVIMIAKERGPDPFDYDTGQRHSIMLWRFDILDTKVTEKGTGKESVQLLEARVPSDGNTNGEGVLVIRLGFIKDMATWVAIRDIRLW